MEDGSAEGWSTLAWINDYEAFAFEVQAGASHEGLASVKLALYGESPWWTVLQTRLDVGLAGAYQTSFNDPGQLLLVP